MCIMIRQASLGVESISLLNSDFVRMRIMVSESAVQFAERGSPSTKDISPSVLPALTVAMVD